MNNTKIAWTNKTWNPVTGCTKYSAGCANCHMLLLLLLAARSCTKYSAGCANCYAEVMTRRFKKAFPNGFNVTLHPERLNEPKKVTDPTMFFVCSMADLFHDDVPFEYIDRVMQTIRDCQQHTFQLLTKRTARMSEYFETRSVPENCWIGTTVEKEDCTHRIDILAYITSYSSSVHFLSCEPLLSDLGELDLSGIDWVIVGGETGPKARPMKKEWVKNIKRQCDEQGVPFFFKSWGRYGEDGKPCPKDQHDLLDGVKFQAYPKGGRKEKQND